MNLRITGKIIPHAVRFCSPHIACTQPLLTRLCRRTTVLCISLCFPIRMDLLGYQEIHIMQHWLCLPQLYLSMYVFVHLQSLISASTHIASISWWGWTHWRYWSIIDRRRNIHLILDNYRHCIAFVSSWTYVVCPLILHPPLMLYCVCEGFSIARTYPHGDATLIPHSRKTWIIWVPRKMSPGSEVEMILLQ